MAIQDQLLDPLPNHICPMTDLVSIFIVDKDGNVFVLLKLIIVVKRI